jgi:hypothetical protein
MHNSRRRSLAVAIRRGVELEESTSNGIFKWFLLPSKPLSHPAHPLQPPGRVRIATGLNNKALGDVEQLQ